MTLAQARAAIDQIDRELAELMCRRMELTDEVAQQKRQQGLPVFQASRERQVLALRYYHGMTQQDAARVLHVSQVQISRLERRAVETLRKMLV